MDISVNTLSTKSTISNQSLYKILNLTVVSLSLQAILLPLVVTGNSAVVRAEEFQSKQLIAQSCRNIDVRASNGQNRNIRKGTRGGTCGYQLYFQSDGNLVFTNRSGQVLWATGTEGRGEILSLQSDGNLVMYGGGRAIWATNTNGNPGAFLAIQADGNLVIYRSDGQQALWASNTDGGQARTTNAAGQWPGGGQSQVQVPQPSQPKQGRSDEFNRFYAQTNGKKIADPNGYYPGQCVSLVKQWGAFIGRRYGFWSGDYPEPAFNAYRMGDKRMVGDDPNTSIISDWRQLQAGDIIIMRGYPSHTGIASGKISGSRYEMLDQNSPQGSEVTLHTYDGSNFIGAIRYN
jgi:hypothetical protein